MDIFQKIETKKVDLSQLGRAYLERYRPHVEDGIPGEHTVQIVEDTMKGNGGTISASDRQ